MTFASESLLRGADQLMANNKTISKGILTALWIALASLAPASVMRAASFAVNSTADAVDALPGDGLCATSAGECTLRAAIQETNALSGLDLIRLPGATYRLTIPEAGEDASATGDLDITDDLIIRGAGPSATIVDGGGLHRLFHMPGQNHVTIQGLTVQNGNALAAGSGGGILNAGGWLLLQGVHVRDNSATYGGGIMNGGGAGAVIQAVTVSGNSAAYGGGIYTRDSGLFLIVNSTISHNVASTGGGGIDTWFHARLSMINATIAANSAPIGAGIYSEPNSDYVFLSGSIVGANSSGQDCAGIVLSTGYNLDSDRSCNLIQFTDRPGRDPVLGPLQNNGGPTPTHALLDGSPAIDAGGFGCPLLDQRFYPRRQDGNGDGVRACDTGAYEKQEANGTWISDQ